MTILGIGSPQCPGKQDLLSLPNIWGASSPGTSLLAAQGGGMLVESLLKGVQRVDATLMLSRGGPETDLRMSAFKKHDLKLIRLWSGKFYTTDLKVIDVRIHLLSNLSSPLYIMERRLDRLRDPIS